MQIKIHFPHQLKCFDLNVLMEIHSHQFKVPGRLLGQQWHCVSVCTK